MQGDNAGGYTGGYGGIQGDTGPQAPADPAGAPRRRMMHALRLAVEAQERTRTSGYDRAQAEYERLLWGVLEARARDYRASLDAEDACKTS